MRAGFTLFRAPVEIREELGPGLVRLTLAAPELREAAPGQFVAVLCRDPDARDPLIRRPFSLAGVDRARGLAHLVVKVVGRGSAWLAARARGDVLDVMGPLGRAFAWPGAGAPGGVGGGGGARGPVLLVGGGTGIAPLLFFARELATRAPGATVRAVVGFRSAARAILVDDLRDCGVEVLVATEDGSLGQRGTAAQVAATVWHEARAVFACGPWGMLQALERLRRRDPRPMQVAVETVMGCGAGACLSCVLPWRRARGHRVTGWARACVEGPVFDAEELVWERCPA